MTDLEIMKEAFAKIGLTPNEELLDNGNIVLGFVAKKYDNVVGYGGFVADFSFDTEGKFENLGIWE